MENKANQLRTFFIRTSPFQFLLVLTRYEAAWKESYLPKNQNHNWKEYDANTSDLPSLHFPKKWQHQHQFLEVTSLNRSGNSCCRWWPLDLNLWGNSRLRWWLLWEQLEILNDTRWRRPIENPFDNKMLRFEEVEVKIEGLIEKVEIVQMESIGVIGMLRLGFDLLRKLKLQWVKGKWMRRLLSQSESQAISSVESTDFAA